MGKLHTLKRAIEREPEKWFWGKATPRGAYHAKTAGTWCVSWSNSYRGFVASVLKSTGKIK